MSSSSAASAAGGLPAVQLCVSTPWSFHYGASPVEQLAEQAARSGLAALGMTDRNGLWGAVPFQKACEARGIRPIHGLWLHTEETDARLLAHDAAGYASLCRLSTRLQFERVDSGAGEEAVAQRLPRWIAEEGEGFALVSGDGALLAELVRLRGPDHLYATDPRLAAQHRLPWVAAPPVFFARPEDWERHRLLAAIGANTVVSRLDSRALAPRSAWLRGAAELREAYRDAPEALRAAAELAERCRYRIPLGEKRLPRFAVPGGRSALSHLARLCQRGRRRRRLRKDPRYDEQLHRELRLIDEQGFADYFLIVADIVRHARSEGIQNCGRGSVANSLVSYLLGLTHVDPLVHGLYFERFMNRGRSDCPDVDLDFAWDERDRVLDYVYRRYGRERVAMISTHQTFALRGAVRELAKVMGLPPAEIGPVTRALPGHWEAKLGLEQLSHNPRTARLPLGDEPWRTILAQAAALDGFPRHLGIHSGGIVIAPSPLTDHLPLQYAAKETDDGRVVITQWDMYPVEDAGLVKIDLLGNRGLAVIRDGVAAVERNTGLKLDFQRIRATRDSRTCAILEQGDTMGCFYIESPSMRSLLLKLRCRDFATLVAASSIIRPGIASSGMMRAYIDRYHHAAEHGAHDDSWYLHPALRELLGETFGVMTYQEDVLKVVQAVAGMSAEDGDGIRRAMSKKRAYQHLEGYAKRFLQGAAARGMPPDRATELWRQIESFSGYSFCKAHSASYAEVSFQSAYLRAHHPAEFMAAVLANYGGYYSTFAYLAEARRMGLELELPDVNRAGATFQGCRGTVQVGLCQIRGLSMAAAAAVLSERQCGGPFASQDELTERIELAPGEFEALIRAGALDELADGWNRPERMRAAALYARRFRNPLTGKGSLFRAGEELRRPPPAPDYSRRRMLQQEWEALDFLVSAHPLSLFHDAIRESGAVPARKLRDHLGERVRLVGWQVTQKPVRTRTGKPMMFLSFEDTTALYETVMFPEAYRRLAPWILTRGPYLLEGVPRDEYGAITVEVSHLRLLDGAAVAAG